MSVGHTWQNKKLLGIARHLNNQGFLLPTVIILSLAITTISTFALTIIVESSVTLNNQQLLRQARQAADAGVTAASNCLNRNDGEAEWSDATPLTPELACTGTASGSIQNFVFEQEDDWKSTFQVGTPSTADDVATITSLGTVRRLHNGVPIGDPITYTVKAKIGTSNPRPIGTVREVYAGTTHTCALTLSNLPYCWGGSTFGQIGDNDSSLVTKGFTPSPRAVAQIPETSGKTYSALTAAGAHTCGIVEGKIVCWGGNGHAQIGVGTTGFTGGAPLWTAVPMVTNLTRMGANIPSKIEGGMDVNCAIASGKVYCWGYTANGQTGAAYDTCVVYFWGCIGGLTVAVTTPKAVTGTIAPLTAIDVSTGGYHSCAVDSVGNAHCWGLGAQGQLGRNSTASSQPSVAVQKTAPSQLGTRTITDISVGQNHTCAITNPDGELFCWGDNTYGEVGINSQSSTPITTPRNISAVSPVLTGKRVTAVATGNAYTCAVADNEVYCWGANNVGQLGLGFTSNTYADPDNPTPAEQTGAVTPTLVNSSLLTGKEITHLSAKGAHTCVVADYFAYCWGYNVGGQLGDGTQTDRNTPVAVISKDLNVSGRTATDISMGSAHTCAITGGKIVCWGQNSWGQLGNGEALVSYVASPTLTAGTAMGNRVATQVVASRFTFFVGGDQAHSCAIADGDGFCWGSNLFGQLGGPAPSEDELFTPQPVSTSGALSGKKLIDIGTGFTHTCAVANDHRAYCWGSGLDGQHGNGAQWNLTNNPTPVSTTSGDMLTKNVTDIDAGFLHSCAIAEDKVYCWGANNVGQLGDGTTSLSTVPRAVLPMGLPGQVATSISTGANYTCAVVGGTAYCWGDNTYGQLGQPLSLTSSNIPLPVGGLLAGKNVSKISTNSYHTCAIADGDAYCWGSNSSYQLGNGTNVSSDTPVMVQKPGWLAGRAISHITTGTSSTCLIADLKPYCWGHNSSGQLGDTTITTRQLPTLVFSFDTLTNEDDPEGGGTTGGGGFSGIIRY